MVTSHGHCQAQEQYIIWNNTMVVCPGLDQLRPQRRAAWGHEKMGTFSVQLLFSLVISSLQASTDGHSPSTDFHVSPFLKTAFLHFDFGFICWILGKHSDLWLWKHSVFFYQRNKKQFSFYWDSCFHFSTYSKSKRVLFPKAFLTFDYAELQEFLPYVQRMSKVKST